MGKRVLVLLMVLGFVSSASAGLVHEWLFEDNLTDTSGSGNDGVMIEGTAAYAAGKVGQAYDFRDASALSVIECVGASNLPTDGSDPWSINMWMYNYGWSEQGYSSRCGGFGDPGYGKFRHAIFTPTDNMGFYNGGTYGDTGLDYKSNVWEMITITFGEGGITDNGGYGRGEVKMYSDKIEMGSWTQNLYDTGGRVTCGQTPAHTTLYLRSTYLDQFRIYDHVLSSSEINDLYDEIPEPATICLLGIGGLALLRKKR